MPSDRFPVKATGEKTKIMLEEMEVFEPSCVYKRLDKTLGSNLIEPLKKGTNCLPFQGTRVSLVLPCDCNCVMP